MAEDENALAAPAMDQIPEDHQPLASTIDKVHSAAAAQLGKLTEAKGMVEHIRAALQGLAAMGDNVTPEDVIKGAGSVVAKGGDPMAMASLLADMPQGGQALGAWVASHEQQLAANEQQLEQQLANARHGAGVAAMHLIAMHHIGNQFGGAPAPGQNAESSNALN